MTRFTHPLETGEDDGTDAGNTSAFVISRKRAILSGAVPTTANVITPIASANAPIPDGANIIRASYRNFIATGSAASYTVRLGTIADSNEYGQVTISAMGDYTITLSARSAVSANSPLVITMVVPTTAQVSALVKGSSDVSGHAYIEFTKA